MTRAVVGDYGIEFPADVEGLRAAGTEFLTAAFHATGVLSPDNSVTAIEQCTEVGGGSTGRKALLTVRYHRPEPGLHNDLFAKFSRDFDDPVRDRGKTQMEQEVRFAALALGADFPIPVPRPQFGDYQAESGTGLLITERIAFGHNGIEPQYEKCLDFAMPDQFGHYRALLTTVARLAGTEQAGLLPARVDQFPLDLRGANVGSPITLPAEKLQRRLHRLDEFASTHPGLLPERVRDAGFLRRFALEVPRVLASQDLMWQDLAAETDHLGLCHWNANVDNAWFFPVDGELRCGLLDWGCVGRMNVAMPIWGALCAAETSLWDQHFDDLLTVFTDEVRRSGGATLDPGRLGRQVLAYAAVMGATWLLDVPGRLRATLGAATTHLTRFDPEIRDDESLRAPLQMLTNLLNLWATREAAAPS